jgi:hypothetical protein
MYGSIAIAVRNLLKFLLLESSYLQVLFERFCVLVAFTVSNSLLDLAFLTLKAEWELANPMQKLGLHTMHGRKTDMEVHSENRQAYSVGEGEERRNRLVSISKGQQIYMATSSLD